MTDGPYRTPGQPRLTPAPPTIRLHDERTWPPHEDDGTGRVSPLASSDDDGSDGSMVPGGTCVPDCVRCQLIVLREEERFDAAPLDYGGGVFSDDGGYAVRERVRELEGTLNEVRTGVIKPKDLVPAPGCTRYGHHVYAHPDDDDLQKVSTDICIYCHKPRSSTP